MMFANEQKRNDAGIVAHLTALDWFSIHKNPIEQLWDVQYVPH